MKFFYGMLAAILIVGCNNQTSNTPPEDSVVLASENIAEERSAINPKAVKTYSETIKSFETTDEFKVNLFETKQTFRYLVKIQYKGLEEDDTLRVPNFGVQPMVNIIKGDSIRPSCIIGFLDKDKTFKESKMVFFKNDKLRVKVLKHYAVYQSK